MFTEPNYMCCKLKIIILFILLGFPSFLVAAPVVLGQKTFAVPGKKEPTPWLRYQHPRAKKVFFAGSWDQWAKQHPMESRSGVWQFNMQKLRIPCGRYTYKFIVDGKWEKGANRILYVNNDSQLETPSELIVRSVVQSPNQIEVFLKDPLPKNTPLKVYVSPEVVVDRWHLTTPGELGYPEGFMIRSGTLTFILSEKAYDLDLSPTSVVSVAGNFNGWNAKAGIRWQLHDRDDDDQWELSMPLQALRRPPGEKDLLFKLVVDGDHWLFPLERAQNYTPDGNKNANLRIDPLRKGSSSILIETEEPLDVSRYQVVTIHGLAKRPVYSLTTPGEIMDSFYSDKPMGVQLRKDQDATTYRLFAPRAKAVFLCLYDRPRYHTYKPKYKKFKPVARYSMWKDSEDGVWELSLRGVDIGTYYSFNVEGQQGVGEGFMDQAQTGDPYAMVAAHAENNALVIDIDATNEWFAGWTDQDYSTRQRENVVIYETHIRDLTQHRTSGVSKKNRGKYAGVIESEQTDTGLAHLKWLGVNTLEFLPISEFNNGSQGFNWGYTTVFYFAPEGTYAHKPLEGSQYYEYKTMIDQLHERNFGVVMDVVYNHVGWPNIFSLIDRKYFFRLNEDFSHSNFSGCGNDVRSEAPMMRRLIVDNIVHWMEEFHVDGFRLDLAELIDMETMMQIEEAAMAINPNVLLISEPWSLRGENKHELTGTEWSAWNNDFRYAAKDFLTGKRNREWLKKCIFGSLNTWAETPLQAINYLESHDDHALVDELCSHPDRNGKNLLKEDVKANRLGATILFTSLGIPMIAEGQEFLRHKEGIENTYNQGDRINALDWALRERPMAKQTMLYYRDLIHLRLSAEGQSLRLAERPSRKYYRWIEPKSKKQVLGYIVNADKSQPGRRFLVLLNASYDKATVQISFPRGRWRLIGNGKRVKKSGFKIKANKKMLQGPKRLPITIPGITGLIFMDGF